MPALILSRRDPPGGEQDRVCHLGGRERIYRYGNVCYAIEGQTALVTGSQVGVVRKDGSRGFGAAAPGQGCFKGNLQVDHECAWNAEEHVPGLFALDGTASECEDKGTHSSEARNGGMFPIAKGRLAVSRKDLSDRNAALGLDYIIDVDEPPAETLGNHWSDGGFS